MNDISTYVSAWSNEMIVDLDCSNSVIGRKDEKNFYRNLSKYQRENLLVVSAEENFKFGPSGPFRCKEKLRFPIDIEEKRVFVEVAIVDAEIPMLMGNNILKPLEAEIKLFSSGNGIIKLGEIELEMKKTSGGHYTVKVEDLSKLCLLILHNEHAKGIHLHYQKRNL